MVCRNLDARECARIVAIATRCVGSDVGGRLAACVHTIVAGLARRGILHHHMAEDNTRKTGKPGRMATVTRRIGRNMCCRFGRGAPWVTLRVAGCAILWRAFEDSVDMAGLATHNLVRSSQIKSCAEMVERRANLLAMRQPHTTKLEQQEKRERSAIAHHGKHLPASGPDAMQ